MNARSWYDETIPPYLVWSKNLNIHFGYWRWGVNPFRLESMLSQMNEEVLSRLRLEPTSSPNLLDAGCGTGATMQHFASRQPSAKFHGVTLSPQQVFFGEKAMAEAGLSDWVQLHLGDFQAMDFKPEFFDAAILVESACYADGPGKSKLIRELSRVLKPGGRIVAVDGFRRHSRPFPTWLDRLYHRNLSRWAITELADVQLFAKNLAIAGFENIQVEDISWHMAPSAMHIPFVVARLLSKSIWRSEHSAAYQRYAWALLHTFFLGFFRKHFGYFIVSAELGGLHIDSTDKTDSDGF